VPFVAVLIAHMLGRAQATAEARKRARENADARKEEREFAALLARQADRRKVLMQLLDRKIELLKTVSALHNQFASGLNHDPQQVDLFLRIVTALASVVLDSEGAKRVVTPFERLQLRPRNEIGIEALEDARQGIQYLIDSISCDTERLNRLTSAKA